MRGLKFNGLTDYLQLPSMTLDAIEVQCSISERKNNAYFLDARPELTNGYYYMDSSAGTWTTGAGFTTYIDGVQTSDIPLSQIVNVQLVAASQFTKAVKLLSFPTGFNPIKGTVYSVKCYLAGVLQAEYDFVRRDDAQDQSGNGNHATIVGALPVVRSATVIRSVQQGLNFTGLNENAPIPIGAGVNPLNAKIVIEMYVTIPKSAIGDGRVVFGVQNGISQRLYIGAYVGVWDMGIQGNSWGTGEGTIPIVADKKTKLKLVLESGTASLYVDDVFSFSKPYTSYTLSSNFYIGWNGIVGTLSLKGSVHSVSVTIDSQTSLYLFNEGTGTTLTDSSGNGNDGTIVGAQWLMKKAVKVPKKNLLPDFSKWTLHANAIVTEPYKLTLNATASVQSSSYIFNCLPNKDYTINLDPSSSINSATQVDLLDINGNTVTNGIKTESYAHPYTFNSGEGAKIRVFVFNKTTSSAGMYTFTNPQLELGSVATDFEPYTLVNRPAT